jgi:hypothetical protein
MRTSDSPARYSTEALHGNCDEQNECDSDESTFIPFRDNKQYLSLRKPELLKRNVLDRVWDSRVFVAGAIDYGELVGRSGGRAEDSSRGWAKGQKSTRG